MPRKITYEILVWVGAVKSSRSVEWFYVTNKKPHINALNWFKEMHQQAIDDRDDGMPYISIKKWFGEEDFHEFGDGGCNAGFDGEFSDLPKYVQQSIAPLVEYQSQIDYTIDYPTA